MGEQNTNLQESRNSGAAHRITEAMEQREKEEHSKKESKSKDCRDGGMVPQPSRIVEQNEQGLHVLRDSSNG